MGKGFPEGSTAFLVIHGIGEQNPFETLDSFTRGFVKLFTDSNQALNISHRISERKDSCGASWTESFVRLQPDKGDGFIDIHEYYWAYLTEEKITVPEVGKWVEQTLEGTRRFYDENVELRRKYEKDGVADYRLTRVFFLLHILSVIYPLLKVVAPLLSYLIRLPLISGFKKGAVFLESLLRPVIVGYIGDIAIYTTVDEKSRFFEVRRKILAESQLLIESLLTEEIYNRIIIVGHSLGSVIAYDTLNSLNLRANLPNSRPLPLEKIKGLITFGSPLDKIAFFFREHASREQYVRRQIMEQLHSFRTKKFDFEANLAVVNSTITSILKGIKWVNYYDMLDPVSGHLDFYDVDENKELLMHSEWGVAHTAYWEHEPMYEEIAKKYF